MFTRESEWQRHVVAQARVHGWRVGVASSSHSDAGHPDLVLIHPSGDVLFAELKTDTSSATREQKASLAAVKKAGCHAYLWRPRDIEEVIARLKRAPAPAGQPPKRISHAAQQQTTLRAALDAVASTHGIETDELLGDSREQRIMDAKWDYLLCARELTGASLPAIGRSIGRDHTTVLHGLRRAEVIRKPSTGYSQAREAVIAALRALP